MQGIPGGVWVLDVEGRADPSAGYGSTSHARNKRGLRKPQGSVLRAPRSPPRRAQHDDPGAARQGGVLIKKVFIRAKRSIARTDEPEKRGEH